MNFQTPHIYFHKNNNNYHNKTPIITYTVSAGSVECDSESTVCQITHHQTEDIEGAFREPVHAEEVYRDQESVARCPCHRCDHRRPSNLQHC